MSTEPTNTATFYDEDPITYTVTVHVLTEYTVEGINAASPAEAKRIALNTLEDDFSSWSTKEVLKREVTAVEEDFC